MQPDLENARWTTTLHDSSFFPYQIPQNPHVSSPPGLLRCSEQKRTARTPRSLSTRALGCSDEGRKNFDMEGAAGWNERWVHVLYFLSRDGEVEQPHLIRVLLRRRRRDTVLRLRDVKRWMSELRGTGMPNAFAWACKRRYKSGYVWADLTDGDAITPIFEGDVREYVLMGSVITHNDAGATEPISSASSSSAVSSAATARISAEEAASPMLTDPKSGRPHEMPLDDHARGDDASPTPPPPLIDDEEDGESEEVDVEAVFVSEALVRKPIRDEGAAFREESPEHRACDGEAGESATGHDVGGTEPRSREEEDGSRARADNAGSEGDRGGRTPRAFWNLLWCGADAVQTHDSALMPLDHGRPSGGAEDSNCTRRSCHRGERVQAPPTDEGNARANRGGKKSPLRSRGSGGGVAAEQRKTAAATEEASKSKPGSGITWPLCSQCGRRFMPERLHSHMRSCKALKGHRRGTGSGKMQQQKGGTQKAMPSEQAAAPLCLLGY